MLGLDDFVVVDFVVESGAICVPEVAEWIVVVLDFRAHSAQDLVQLVPSTKRHAVLLEGVVQVVFLHCGDQLTWFDTGALVQHWRLPTIAAAAIVVDSVSLVAFTYHEILQRRFVNPVARGKSFWGELVVRVWGQSGRVGQVVLEHIGGDIAGHRGGYWVRLGRVFALVAAVSPE